MNGIIEILPQYVLFAFFAVIAVIVALIVLSVWSNIAPAAPGDIKGYLKLVGRYAEGKLHTEIEGTIVDVTDLFLNPETQERFKTSLIEFWETTKNPEIKISEIQEAKKLLETYPLNKVCRLLVTRERLFTKHFIVQVKRIASIETYGSKSEKPKFTFSDLFLNKGIVNGIIINDPGKTEVYKIGKCYIHTFIPDSRGQDKEEPLSIYSDFAKLSTAVPAVADLDRLVKTERERTMEQKRENQRLISNLRKAQNQAEYWKEIAIMKSGGSPLSHPHGRWEVKDIILLGAPAIAGYYIVSQYYVGVVDPLFGALVGLIAGYVIRRLTR